MARLRWASHGKRPNRAGSPRSESRLEFRHSCESRLCWPEAASVEQPCWRAAVQTTISARHGHLSPVTQAKITEKVEVVRKFFDRLTAISVTVDLEHAERPNLELRA